MTSIERLATVGITAAVTLILRALPFLFFSGKGKPPAFVTWLGRQLPRAVMAMLVIYCLKDETLTAAPWAIPALAAIAVTVLLHLWQKKMILSISAGTAVYMVLIRLMAAV